MPLTPEDVQNKRFRTVRGPFKEGYDEEEVDAFLDEVEAELRRLLAEGPPAGSGAAVSSPVAESPTEEPNEAALRTLLLAQRTADEAIAQAKAEAEQIVTSAKTRAASIESEAQQQHAGAMADLARQRQALEGQIEQLRGFEKEYRTRLKAYLEGQLRDLEKTVGPPAPAAPPTAPGPAAPASPPVAASSPPPGPVPPGPVPPGPVPVPPTPPRPAPADDKPAPPVPQVAPGPTRPATAPSPFSIAPPLVEEVDMASDAPTGPPREPGEDASTDEA